jgi:hypothetical protein
VSESSEEFRQRALECFRWAQEAVGPRGKKSWLIMAQLWLDRAENAERDDRQGGAPSSSLEGEVDTGERARRNGGSGSMARNRRNEPRVL